MLKISTKNFETKYKKLRNLKDEDFLNLPIAYYI